MTALAPLIAAAVCVDSYTLFNGDPKSLISGQILQLDIGRSVYHFLQYIYTFQRDTQCSSTDCLLMLRCQLYMFRTVTVHPQVLLFVRCCMCRLWCVLICPAGTTFFLKCCTSRTYQDIP